MKEHTQIPKDALFIIDTLEQHGHEAYVVGGCVRDMIMGREPNDWDITTSAKPEEVKAAFKRTYDTGIQHGTVTVIVDKEHYEVTTYRIEGEYKDSRRPEHVSFVTDITLDLSRRDFTMNAIAYHPVRGFVDPYNGKKHIEQSLIKSVRDAKERFTEDALRILRAVRFSAQLGFKIDDNTIEGIKACKHLLKNISKERIRDEFLKICMSDRPEAIHTLYELGLLEYILPEFIQTYATAQNHPHHVYDVAHHTIEAMRHTPKNEVLRLSMLLHDIGKAKVRSTDKKGIDHFYGHPEVSADIAKKVLKDLRLDNQTIKEVTLLVSYHDYHLRQKITKVYIKEILKVTGEALFDQLLLVNEADARAQSLDKLPMKLEQIAYVRKLKEEVVANHECYNLKMLAINGGDLIKEGIAPGKAVGEALEKALKYVIKYPEKNTKEVLVEYIKE
ncbi:MAG: CCA tRNA nucleotidyltransferase [Candidatus Niameybacter stercoravium]|nr:CCA tRNA nucleotidyltransferase [Candidatus Niameybacter stercoravium]